MPNLAVVDMEGKNVGTIELAESVFGIEPNAAVMHQMVVNYLAAQRQGTQSALTRSEVSGGGKKPWRQKGTGRARYVLIVFAAEGAQEPFSTIATFLFL